MGKKRALTECDYSSIIKSKGKHKYDFPALEHKVQKSYDNFLQNPTNTEYFQQLFKDLFVITFGILETSEYWVKQGIVVIDVAHEYSTQLIERVLGGRFRAHLNPGEDKFAWVPYIRLNVRDTMRRFSNLNPERYVSLDDLSEVVNDFSSHSGDDYEMKLDHPATVDMESYYQMELTTNDNQLAVRCSKFLQLMFGEDKYYTLSSKLLALKEADYNNIQDEELRCFCKTALVLFKRLWETYNLSKVNARTVDKVFNSSLYLASILSSQQDKRLYIALDLANLYRLSLSHGGELLKVPTVDDLDELVSTAKVSYEILSTNLKDIQNIRKIRNKIKDEYNVSIRSDKLAMNVRNVFRYLSTEISDPSVQDNSLVNSLISLTTRSDQIVNRILDKLEQTLDQVDSSDELIKVYKEMIDNLTLSLNLMTNIKNLVESRFSKPEIII